jgi:methionine-gamma-lyase
MNDKHQFATLAVHAGEAPCPVTGAVDTPIYQSTTFAAEDSDEMAALYSGEKPGYMYTRYGNPTVHALEEKVAALEGGEAAQAFATGMAAVSSSILGFVKAGDHVVAARSLYGATYNFLNRKLPAMGASTTFVQSTRAEDFERALQPNTRLIYFESPSNPILEILDIEALAAVARAHGIPSLVDNTFASPALQQPLKIGISAVMHSATKYLCGHGDAMGGITIGSEEYIHHLSHDVVRDFGGVMSPFTAWLMLRGIRTLHVRMPVHCSNAQKIAEFLVQHPHIERVYYPGLPHHPGHDLARRQMSGFGGMMSFEARGGYESGKRVMDKVRIFLRAASLGDTRSLIVHPASTSHRAVPREQRESIGITDGLVRLSVGIEAVDDLIGDLRPALEP